MGDWSQWSARLIEPGEGRSVDEVCDDRCALVLAAAPDSGASAVLCQALAKASAAISRRSAAIALAYCAANEDRLACDAFVDSFREHRGDAFLGPAILAAWAMLAGRSPIARIDITAALLRLQGDEGRYLLVKAAKVVGRLEEGRTSPDLRAFLNRLVDSGDPAVAAEARQQAALLAFQDALLAPDRNGLRERLTEARAAFARAGASEEQRPDACLFILLLDAILRFLDGGQMHDVALAVRVPLHECAQLLHEGGPAFWGAYRSDDQDRLATHALAVIESLGAAAQATADAEGWLNLEEALLGLAALYDGMRKRPDLAGHGRSLEALGQLADRALAPSLGPVLARAVNATRMRKIVVRYESLHGDDEAAKGLRALEEAAARCEPLAALPVGDGLLEQVVQLANRVGQPPEAFLREFLEATKAGTLASWCETIGLSGRSLPIDRPDLFGGDPAVDDAVRAILLQTRERLGSRYPRNRWNQLISVVAEVVSFIHFLRDELPDFLLSEEEGGLGRTALEKALQDPLFAWLRARFGRAAVYERAPLGGGRSDSGLLFPECEFPFEVKREFSTVDREHVRANYLGQPDDYAAVRERVCFLLLLDLRKGNAMGGKTAKKSATPAVPNVALYSLRESFWVDGLPPDPQIQGATANAVIVGLVPGNRLRPSRKTVYSSGKSK